MGTPSDWDELFRPVIGRRTRGSRERVPSLRAIRARAIQKRGGQPAGGRGKGQRLGTIAVREPSAASRRCVVKAHYVPLHGGGLKKAKLHLAYLERDGVEREGAPGRLYGADEGFDREAFGRPLAGEQRQFRFTVSPEDGDQLDLPGFTRRLMEQVEKDIGRRLIWAAVNHHNTDNPHVHIVVRGVDADGDDLRINGRYIAEGMRWRAQELATRELGPRSELEMERSQSKEIERAGFTAIDRMLAGHALADGSCQPNGWRRRRARSARRVSGVWRCSKRCTSRVPNRPAHGGWPTTGRRSCGSTRRPSTFRRGWLGMSPAAWVRAWSCNPASASRRSRG